MDLAGLSGMQGSSALGAIGSSGAAEAPGRMQSVSSSDMGPVGESPAMPESTQQAATRGLVNSAQFKQILDHPKTMEELEAHVKSNPDDAGAAKLLEMARQKNTNITGMMAAAKLSNIPEKQEGMTGAVQQGSETFAQVANSEQVTQVKNMVNQQLDNGGAVDQAVTAASPGVETGVSTGVQVGVTALKALA